MEKTNLSDIQSSNHLFPFSFNSPVLQVSLNQNSVNEPVLFQLVKLLHSHLSGKTGINQLHRNKVILRDHHMVSSPFLPFALAVLKDHCPETCYPKDIFLKVLS